MMSPEDKNLLERETKVSIQGSDLLAQLHQRGVLRSEQQQIIESEKVR